MKDKKITDTAKKMLLTDKFISKAIGSEIKEDGFYVEPPVERSKAIVCDHCHGGKNDKGVNLDCWHCTSTGLKSEE